MAAMSRSLADLPAHPLRCKPYDCIRFKRVDGNGASLYIVGNEDRARGAIGSLRAAFLVHGGHCFHCKTKLKAGALADVGSVDHVRPKSGNGSDELHNLVIACKHCNKLKGNRPLARFNGDLGDEYLVALDEFVSGLVKSLRDAATSDPAY